MSRIFISYKRVDKDKVFKIKDQIESALGEKCWIDIDGIESDSVFANKIIGAINNCEVFLFMFSKSHREISDYENDWTIRELNFAQDKKKRIVFINIDRSELSDWFKLLFGTKQQVDGTSRIILERLCEDLEFWLYPERKEERVRIRREAAEKSREEYREDVKQEETVIELESENERFRTTNKSKKSKIDNTSSSIETTASNNVPYIYVVVIAFIVSVIGIVCYNRGEDDPIIDVVVANETIVDNVKSNQSEESSQTCSADHLENSEPSEAKDTISLVHRQKDSEKIAQNSGTLDLGYATWKGGIKKGKPDGVGVMTFKKEHRLDSETTANPGDRFDGSFTNGQIEIGKLYRSNGEIITIIGEN